MTKEQATREALRMALEALETNNKAWKNLADSGDAGFWEAEEQPFYEIAVKAIIAIKKALAQPEQEPVAKNMTAHRAAYFMERFKHEEKLLGPNEQAALDFVIALLEAQPEQAPVVWMYQNKSTHEVQFQKYMRSFVDHSAWYEVPLYSEPLANQEKTSGSPIKEALAQPEQERNFCQRCGKRLGKNDWDVHTCTPPQPEQEPVAMKFKIYKPTAPDPVRQGINNALLPWVYDQDRSSGFDASMWVTPVATLPPQRTWVGLTDEDKQIAFDDTQEGGGFWEFADAIEAKLKEKNNG